MRGRHEMTSKSVCIAFARGCPRAEMDTAWLFPYFRANGWDVVHRVEDADLLVAAACGFDAAAERESVRRLALLEGRLRTGAQFVVIGCLAGIRTTFLGERFHARAIRPADIRQLDHVISAEVPLLDVPPVNDVGPYLAAAARCWPCNERYPRKELTHMNKRRQRICLLLRLLGLENCASAALHRWRRIAGGGRIFRIRIARGCLEECSYCVIRHGAGALCSTPMDDVLAQFDAGLSKGYELFSLIAEDTGAYGLDIGTTLPQLLARLFSRPGKFKIVLTDLNVRYWIRYAAELTELLVSNRSRISYLTVPVQSGSDRVLEGMRRCYRRADVMECLCRLREACPSMSLRTHVLVGFPGETQDDFADTATLLQVVQFARVEVYRYADRPGTLASQMDHKVPEAVKDQRIGYLFREFPQALYCSAGSPPEETASSRNASRQTADAVSDAISECGRPPAEPGRIDEPAGRTR